VHVRSDFYEELNKALDVVKQFIIDKNLILVGGMAIDYALKLKGDMIYSDDQLPDYDFYSPSHTEHAYELGAMLCKMGFENVSCIQAMHITTMKVRVNFETVADITHCPKKVWEQVPTIMYNKLRIVHPNFQMIDQHSSLSMPFENPGREVIFHRWKKDLVRYDKLYKHYPIVSVEDVIETPHHNNGITISKKPRGKYGTVIGGYTRSLERERKAKELELPMQLVDVPLDSIRGGCICGWGAVGYVLSDAEITLQIPTGESISIASNNYKEFIKVNSFEIAEYYSEYFGKLPRRVVCPSDIRDRKKRRKNIEIFDVFGLLISAKQISKKYDVWVCNIQWSMLYLLVSIFSSDNPRIVFTAEEQYLKCRELVDNGDVPSIEVYGTANFTHSYLNMMKRNKERIYLIKAPQLQPVNMYPKPPGCLNDKKFDPETSEYFMTDGREIDTFIEWTLNPYPEYTLQSKKNK
jgi:hypothetical protein